MQLINGTKTITGSGSVVKVATQISLWNMQTNADQCRQIAPRTEPKDTPIEVQVETRTDWRGQPYKQKVIKSIDNQDQVGVG